MQILREGHKHYYLPTVTDGVTKYNRCENRWTQFNGLSVWDFDALYSLLRRDVKKNILNKQQPQSENTA